MIDLLKIINFAHIAELTLSFGRGLNIITGETGAGKSVIIDAIEFALGARASPGVIKDKTKATSVTLVLAPNKPIEGLEEFAQEEGQLIFRRHIDNSGKSKLYLNDVPITAARIKQLQGKLLEISSQHDGINLASQSFQHQLYDKIANINLSDYQAGFGTLRSLSSELDDLVGKNSKLEIELSYLQSVIRDLEQLNYEMGEEELLLEQRKIAQDSFRINTTTTQMSEAAGEILSLISRVDAELRRASSDYFCSELELSDQIWKLTNELVDQLAEKKSQGDNLSLEEIDDRLHEIRSISRKHKITAQFIPQRLEQLKEEVLQLANIDEAIAKLTSTINALELDLRAKAGAISELRKAKQASFEQSVNQELHQLHLPHATFMVKFEESAELCATGLEKISFSIKTNIDTPFAPIDKIASGGELSRIFLALKSMTMDDLPCALLFDEIDSGFSGKVSYGVGRKLKELSRVGQTIAITHQPQVAAFGDVHILVAKRFVDDATQVTASLLTKEEVEREVARMIAGDTINDTALEAARSLIREAA